MTLYLVWARVPLTPDDILNRWSWSDSQGLALSATIIVLYTLFRQEKLLHRLGKRAGLKSTSTTEEAFFDFLYSVRPYWEAAKKELEDNKITPADFALALRTGLQDLKALKQRRAGYEELEKVVEKDLKFD